MSKLYEVCGTSSEVEDLVNFKTLLHSLFKAGMLHICPTSPFCIESTNKLGGGGIVVSP